jgi:SNF2 family DNA or RNA helicase
VIRSRAKAAAPKPMAHQAISLKHDETTDAVFDVSDPGTGKTFVRIFAFAKRRRARGGCALVLAPRSLLKSVWFDDFKKFAPDMQVSIARADNREKAFAVEADVYVTNIDAAAWLAKQKPAFFARFSELIIDESSAYKHHTTQRSRSVAKIAKHFERRACLTGTPNSNSITDVWHQAFILDAGKRLGPSFYAFRNSVTTPEQVGRSTNAIKWHDKEGAEEAVFSLLDDITIRHKFADCVDIPANHLYTVDYELSDKQARAYEQLEMAQVLWLWGDTPAERATQRLTGAPPRLTAINAAAVTTKLLQVASGAVYDNDGNYHLIDGSRYEMVMDLAEVRKHPLVFFLWKHQRDYLVNEADKRGMRYCVLDGGTSDKERDLMVAAYQAGRYDVMFAHPRSAAHGLTLTKGKATIWCSPTADLEIFVQGNRRQARIGQTEKTETIVVLAKGTHDERVYHDILMPKDKRMNNLLDLFGTLKSKFDLKKAA